MENVILKRKSVRTYLNEPLSLEQLNLIKDLITKIKDLKGPFGNQIDITCVLSHKNNAQQEKIGTYGFIKDAPSYIVGVGKKDPQSLIDFGYIFEHLILELTQLGFGTCWLGGTFKRSQFSDLTTASEDLFIPAITPVGIPSEKASLKEKTIRTFAKANARKSSEELFYIHDFDNPILEKNMSKYPLLEYVKWAPSASNKQPWRLLIENDLVHVYIDRTKNYATSLNYDIQLLDIGIALCHYVYTLNHDKVTYGFSYEQEYTKHQTFEYVISIHLIQNQK